MDGCNGYTVVNMAGQVVCDQGTNAGGYYVYTPEAVAEMDANGSNPCGGLRPGKIVIPGAGTIRTCAGRIVTETLPDIHLVNSRFRPWLIGGLFVVVGGILIATVAEGIKWFKR